MTIKEDFLLIQSPEYIGDEIYIQVDPEDYTSLILTTGSHILEDADACIYVGVREAIALKRFISVFLGKNGEETE